MTAITLSLIAALMYNQGTPSGSLAQRHPHVETDVRGLAMRISSLLTDDYKYFRGSADEFYGFAGDACRDWIADGSSYLTIHGDIHIGNSGTYWVSGSVETPELTFGLVDFDEAIEGPFQFDLLRAFTSIRFAASVSHADFSENDYLSAANALVEAYEFGLTNDAADRRLRDMPAVTALLTKSKRNRLEAYLGRYVVLGAAPRFRTARIKNGEVKDILEPIDAAQREEFVDALLKYVTEGCPEATRNTFKLSTREQVAAAVQDVARWTRVGSSGSQGVQKYLVLLSGALQEGPALMILELKEQPVPAVSRAELLESLAGVTRAKQVAEAEGRMCLPPPPLLGFTRMRDRGFVVSLKDPFAEEPDTGDFNLRSNPAGVIDMATILGMATGIAHRNAVRNEKTKIESVRLRFTGLAQAIVERSVAAEARIRSAYQSLRANDDAKELAARAQQFIESAVAGQ